MWFTEDPWPPMIIVAVLALIFVFLWKANSRAVHLMLAIFLGLLCGGIYVMERAIVTDGERLQELTVRLCEDFRDNKPVLDYVSDNELALKGMFLLASKTIKVHQDLRLSDFQSTMKSADEGTVHFRANATVDVGPHNAGYQPARLILTFRREKDQWKVTQVRRLNPINGTDMGLLDPKAG